MVACEAPRSQPLHRITCDGVEAEATTLGAARFRRSRSSPMQFSHSTRSRESSGPSTRNLRKPRYRRAISAVQLTTTVVVGSVRFAVGVNRMNVWSSDVTA